MNGRPIASLADIHARGKDLGLFSRHWHATCKAIKVASPRLILIAGDVWESPTIGDASSMVDDVLAAFLDPVKEFLAEFPIYAVPGNHDIAADTAKNALAALSALPNVTVYRKPTLDHVFKHNIEIAAVPWSWDTKSGGAEFVTESLLNGFPLTSTPRVLLAHGGIIGGRMNNGGHTCEKVTWGFSRKFLENLKVNRAIIGDFHGRNMDLAGPGRGGFVGAVRQTGHGQEGDPQGFEEWDPETGEVKWVEVESYPRHRTVVMMPDDPLPAPEPNLRVQTDGFVLDAVRTKAVQDAGGSVEKVPEPRAERIQRADIPADDLTDYRALFDTYADTLTDIPVVRQLCYDELADTLAEGAAGSDDEPDEITDEAIAAF